MFGRGLVLFVFVLFRVSGWLGAVLGGEVGSPNWGCTVAFLDFWGFLGFADGVVVGCEVSRVMMLVLSVEVI